MDSLETLTTFLGWCTVINIGLLILAGLAWVMLKNYVVAYAAPLFGVTEAETKLAFFKILLQYRTAIVLFNFVPWIALKIMA